MFIGGSVPQQLFVYIIPEAVRRGWRKLVHRLPSRAIPNIQGSLLDRT